MVPRFCSDAVKAVKYYFWLLEGLGQVGNLAGTNVRHQHQVGLNGETRAFHSGQQVALLQPPHQEENASTSTGPFLLCAFHGPLLLFQVAVVAVVVAAHHRRAGGMAKVPSRFLAT